MYDSTDYPIDNLLAWYTSLPGIMGGTRVYDIINGNIGTLQNMSQPFTSTSGWATPTRPYSYGEWRFDGTDDNIATPVLVAPRSTYSISIWFNITGSGQNYLYQESNAAGSHQISFVVGEDTSGDVNFFILDDGVGGFGLSVANSFHDGKWHNGIASFTTTFAELFMDGVSIATTSATTGTVTVDAAAIGSRAYNTGFASGVIDSVQIYKSALKLTEVRSIYNRGRVEFPTDTLRLLGNIYLPSIKPIQDYVR